MRPLSLALLLVALPALAQTDDRPLLVPGADDLATDAVTFGDRTFEVLTGPQAGQSAGVIRQTATADGAYVTVVTRIDVPSFQQAVTDSVRILRASLAPQAATIVPDDGDRATVTFDALRAIGTYGTAGRELPLDVTLKTPTFHAGSSSVSGGEALVAQAAPFREGYTAQFETFSPTQRLREVDLEVTGREDARRLDGTTVSAWVVETVTSGRQPVTRRYYVDPDTRDLLRVVSGAPGREVVVVPADPAALEAAAAARAATPRVRPGDGSLDAGRIPTGQTVSTLNLLEPMAQDGIGTQTQTVTRDEAAGTMTVVTVVEVPMQNLTQTDSLVVAYPSLQPVSQSLTAGPVAIDLAYGDDAVRGSAALPSGTEDVDVALEDGPVFSASALGAVLQALPLEDGYRAVVETFAPGGGLTPISVEVSTDDDGAYTVVATPEGAPASTYTIDAETRAILMTQTSPQQGVTIDVVPQQ